jgi:hypothetical protein
MRPTSTPTNQPVKEKAHFRASPVIRLVKVAAIALSLIPILAFGASDVERELQQLTTDRDRAIVRATESINAKHLARLRARLRGAKKAKDSESVAQITAAIGRTTVIGTWSVVADSGYRTNLTIRPDGSFFGTNENANGRWDIRGGKLIITNPTNQDIFELPTGDEMTGVNTQGPKITASRISR